MSEGWWLFNLVFGVLWAGIITIVLRGGLGFYTWSLVFYWIGTFVGQVFRS